MSTFRRFTVFGLAALLLATSGCSLFKGEAQSPATDPAREQAPTRVSDNADPKQLVAPSNDLEIQQQAKKAPGILIQWQVPIQNEEVTAYHLYYGTEKEQLERHVTIPVTSLDKVRHPELGTVYRYFLEGAPRDRTIYISLRAENQHGRSGFSEVVAIVPGEW